MARPSLIALVLVVAALACSGCSGGQSSPPTAPATAASAAHADHLTWAERLLDGVGPDRNIYASSPTTVTWAGVDGAQETRNRSVCSTLITALLQRAYGYTADDVIGWLGSSSPTASEFYTAISESRGFSQVAHVTDIAPGDLIVVRYPPGSRPTGHIMLVEHAPVPRQATAPVISGTSQYEVTVIDSSNSGHGPGDTRSAGGGKFRSGVGRGALRLYVDSSGAISGYTWSTLAVSKFVSRVEHPLLAGRLDGSWPAGQGRRGRTAAVHGDEDLESGPEANGP
jgi:hypothetical protein